jgi:hypothetical protein
MLILKNLRMTLATLAAALLMLVASACGSGIDPALGARLIFEEQITDQIKAQIILQDMDLLEDEDDEDEPYPYYWRD